MKFKLFLKTFIICMLCFAVFTSVGYFYLKDNLTPADQKTESVPYYQNTCDNKGILLNINGRKTFIYLNFSEQKITVSLNPENSLNGNIYGYSHDYTVNGEDDLLVSVIDNVGGVDLTINGEKLRHTGLQATELLKRTNSTDLRRQVITSACLKIAKYGVNSTFFTDVINHSRTELTVADSYFWYEDIDTLCSNLHFID